MNPNFYPELNKYLEKAQSAVSELSDSRKSLLIEIADYIEQKTDQQSVQLVFICTHNSRRSHLSQLWAVTAARYHGLDFIETFSAGTEATAVYRSVIGALESSGFRISSALADQKNPTYTVSFGSPFSDQKLFSKDLNHTELPQSDYAAIMTCSEADESCPVVFGMDKKVKLFYKDPKEADGTEQEKERYAERCLQIATEMMFLMSQVSK